MGAIGSGARAHRAAAIVVLGLLAIALVVTPLLAEAGTIATCLSPCHGGLGLAPDIATEYDSPNDSAGHRMRWDSAVVANATGAVFEQHARMPCSECHAPHGEGSSSIYSFDEGRAGGPITAVRQLCEGCHRPFDSAAATPTVCGLELLALPPAPADHGDASIRDCFDCHGGSGHGPATHSLGQSCGESACHDSGSHSIHLTQDDPRGPGQLHCYDCHASGDLPYFKTGTDADSSGHVELDESEDCDECHSPGGSYDGVDTTPAPSGALSVGAKDVWATGAYATTSTLQAGKSRWCAGCHDGYEDGTGGMFPSLIDGVYAPPVAGDEAALFTYGTGWGYYKTGHGTPSSTVIPSNGYDTGPGLECDACHDFTQAHIDGDRRTFNASPTPTPTDYRESYRLDLVDGEEPMLVPWTTEPNSADNYRLCTQSGCHDPYPFVTQAPDGTSTPSARRTNFWNDIGWKGWYNYHVYHLSLNSVQGPNRWAPDWGATLTSRIQCMTCHNVHGSKLLAMNHDGSLISDTVDRTGYSIYYINDEISVWNAWGTSPTDVTLAMSDALHFKNGSASRVCSGCHGGGYGRRPRVLWKDYGLQPTLAWTGETFYENDGSTPDTTTVEGTVFFRVEYTDRNNDAPLFVMLRIDRNDDGDCEDTSETVTMEKEEFLDETYYTGVIYKTTVSLAKAGDNEIAYHFEASDGVFPTSMSETRTVVVDNAEPELPWTGDVGYFEDGVAPNGGTTNDTDYEFRITYRDPDGEAPIGGSPLLYIDADDDGQFEAGEEVTMTPMTGGDYASGKRFTYTTKLARQSDDDLLYRFVADDGSDITGTETMTVGVLQNINQAPTLSWTGETDYEADGVDPQSQAGGKPFCFRVTYQDANNHPPLDARVLIDFDDSGTYEASETITMNDSVVTTDLARADGDYSDGEIFSETVYVPFAGDGSLTYCFSFSDVASATGEPMDDGAPGNDKTLTVLEALDVPSEYGAIQGAIDAAVNGQIVLVDDGVYNENIDFDGKDITVESVNGAGSTTLEASGTIVSFETTDSDSILRGFTVSNGTTGVVVGASAVTIQECVVENNSGAGIQYDGPAGDYLVVEDSTISGNHPGVLSTQANYATFRRTDITGNSFGGDGAGINMAGSGYVHSPRWTLEECTFSDNVAGGSGGALYNSGDTLNISISDGIFENNRAEGGDGGAIASFGSPNEKGDIVRTIFRGNYASGDGGAIRVQGTQSPWSRWTYTNCVFSGNYAGGDGGAFYRYSVAAGVTFSHCTFSGNSADRGGGIFLEYSFFDRIKVHNSILYGDDARSSTTRDEWDTFYENYYRHISLRYTDFYQDTYGLVYAEANFLADPMFVNPVAASEAPTSAGDYHIQLGSPCEGSADPSATVTDDIDGQARPQGSAARDSGADEIGLLSAMKFGPVGGSLAVPTEETTHTGPPAPPEPPVTSSVIEESGFLLVGSADPAVQDSEGSGAFVSAARDIGSEVGLGQAPAPLGMPEPSLPAAALGLTSMLALAWKALGRIF